MCDGPFPVGSPRSPGGCQSRRIANQTYSSEWNQYGMSMPQSKRSFQQHGEWKARFSCSPISGSTARGSRPRQPLAPVRDTDASPDIPHLLIMHHGVIDFDPKPEHLGREAPYGGEQGIGGHDTIALRHEQGNPGSDQGLLATARVE